MLAPARSRCRWVAWGPVPQWGVIVAIEEKQSSLNRCVALEALEALEAWGLWGGAAFGVPQRGTEYQPGVKPRVRYTTGAF